LFGEFLQRTERELLDKNYEYVVSHELFHEWFGDLVTCESWSNLPLNESFATYGEYLWDEHKLGKDEADYTTITELNNYMGESMGKQEPLIRFYYKDREDMFDAHSYAKGGLILHMLRKYVGDEAFFESLKLYLNTNKFKSVEIHNLRLAFEEVTGEDLNWFFNQWFMSAGHPQLTVTHTWAAGTLSMNVTQNQDTLYSPVYRLPLYIEYHSGGQVHRQHINITKAQQSFTFPASTNPDYVLFDSEQQLVGVIDHVKTKSELFGQFKYSGNVKARLQALQGLKKNFMEPDRMKVYTEALNDKFWGIRNYAMETVAGDSAAIAANKARVLDIAVNDPKPTVRAEAISSLFSLKDPAHKTIFEKALTAKSYEVNAAGLTQFLLGNSTAKEKNAIIAPFENSNNSDLTGVIAEYYNESREAGHSEWFEKRIKQCTGEGKYVAIQYYGKYITHRPEEERAKGSLLLYDVAKNGATMSARYTAYKALHLNRDVAGNDARLKEIRENEKSATLKQYYEMIGTK
ncbi:MAG: M1 family aminopeptidase, partial [Bacteroidota bacterium]